LDTALNTDRLEQLIRPLVEGSGLHIYDVEFVGRTLRVSIEKSKSDEAGVGVSITDCVETSRMLNAVLDVEDIVPGGAYELEVSSPGLDRTLRKPEHYTRSIGERIHITTKDPMSIWNGSEPFFEKRRNLRGVLTEFSETNLGLTLKVTVEGGRQVVVPFEAVTRAYIDFELKITPKKGKKV
jgi:ribosome maturation factor RimP